MEPNQNKVKSKKIRKALILREASQVVISHPIYVPIEEADRGYTIFGD